MAYLDENGLARFKSKLDDQLDERIEEQSEETSVLLTGKLNIPANVPQGKFLQTNENGEAVWGDGASSSTITTAVNNWLADNVAGGSTIAVDTSLNVTGAAAESKTVGDKLNNQILVQDSQPSSADNKIWVKETPQTEVEVPSYTEFTDLKSAIDYIGNAVFERVDVQYSLANIPGVTKRANSSGTASETAVNLTDNTSYDSYWFVTTEETELYAIPVTGEYMAICKLEGFTDWEPHTGYIHADGVNGVRYRTIESNLPSENSPLTVPTGTLIAITVGSAKTAQIVIKNRIDITLLNEDIKLSKNQIMRSGTYGALQYIGSSGNDDSTERVNVFMPQKTGWLKYEFLHCVSNRRNCNIWRIGRTVKCGEFFDEVTMITTSGEWECAIKLTGRSDFAGGYIHGDEIEDTIEFFIDGKSVTISDYIDITYFKTFSIVQKSSLYDPNDGTTKFADHGSEHIFDITKSKNLVIKQSIKWLGTYTIGNSYLAMIPILKSVTDHFYTDKRFNPASISLDYAESNVKDAVLYSKTSGVSAEFGTPVYPNVDSLSGTLFLTDNSGLDYNKGYYIVGGNNSTISNGTIWRTETEYNISC